jgi:antitoxin component YwqK of YwqJK toxin-antitoxin module
MIIVQIAVFLFILSSQSSENDSSFIAPGSSIDRLLAGETQCPNRERRDVNPCVSPFSGRKWDGEKVSYYPTGETLSVGYYENGVQIQPTVIYTKTGEPYNGLRVFEDDYGFCHKGVYVNGRGVGVYEIHSSDGSPSVRIMFDQEGFVVYRIYYSKYGLSQIFPGRGSPYFHGPMYQYRSSDGTLEVIINHKHCRKHGETTWFDREGNVVRKIFYENGEWMESVDFDTD